MKRLWLWHYLKSLIFYKNGEDYGTYICLAYSKHINSHTTVAYMVSKYILEHEDTYLFVYLEVNFTICITLILFAHN